MKVSFFIDRPVFSAVISILIVIVGIIGLMMLPIDQYPQITPPRSQNQRFLPGSQCRDRIAGSSHPYRTGTQRNTGHALHGIQQFQFRRFFCHGYFRHLR